MEPTDYESQARDHIYRVQAAIVHFCDLMMARALVHDASKLRDPELSGFAQIHRLLAAHPYGSPEYHATLADAHELLARHYSGNSHHPEHYAAGISGMTLMDLVEMFFDWQAASSTTKDGSLARSIAHNVGRFGIEPQLAAILENTRREIEKDQT